MEVALAERPTHDHIFRILSTPAAPQTAPPGWTPPHVISRAYHFPRAELEAMRKAATSGCEEAISVHDALFAHLMQVIGAATGTVGEEPVMVCQAMDGRKVPATLLRLMRFLVASPHDLRGHPEVLAHYCRGCPPHPRLTRPPRPTRLQRLHELSSNNSPHPTRSTYHDPRLPRSQLAPQRHVRRGLGLGQAGADGAGSKWLRTVCDICGWGEGDYG